MTPDELRQAYLDYFTDRDHAVLPSASLVPEDDPTTLFTGSGMQPLLPFFLGQPHPNGLRVVNSQKCFRTQDIEEVGDNRHTTFFEMLGNWSFGDYFKQEQLSWIFDFLTEQLGLDPQQLFVTVYQGNDELGIPADEESVKIWQELFGQHQIEAVVVKNAAQEGLQEGRIFYYGADNWWSRVGAPADMPVGEPGGPDSEIFYDFGTKLKIHEKSEFVDKPCHLNCECGRFLEIGNSVFMTYVKTEQGFEELENKNIDFGGGFERILTAVNDDPDMFKTELFRPIIEYLEENSGLKYDQEPQVTSSFRVIADHMRAATMLAADEVYPSSKEQGYFSRRLIRRSIRYAQLVGIETEFVGNLVPIVAKIYQVSYHELLDKVEKIQEIFVNEEQKFNRALNKGLRVFEKETVKGLTAATAFKLYETYGFPLEMSLEEAQNENISIESDLKNKFDQFQQDHARQSRQASIGQFKGGLGDESELAVKLHTATHLLHAALRQILGQHVEQKGSNINSQRLRFDFSHFQLLTADELRQIENQLNHWIEADLPVTSQVMSKQTALNAGAVAFFIDKYPDEVTIYTIGSSEQGWISQEFCGGPHVEHTGQIGQIKIYKEQSAGAGIRRVYARQAR